MPLSLHSRMRIEQETVPFGKGASGGLYAIRVYTFAVSTPRTLLIWLSAYPNVSE